MSKRRYKITINDADALKAAFPTAVTITERTVTDIEPNYRVIAALLDGGIEVPGVTYVKSSSVDEVAEQKKADEKDAAYHQSNQ